MEKAGKTEKEWEDSDVKSRERPEVHPNLKSREGHAKK